MVFEDMNKNKYKQCFRVEGNDRDQVQSAQLSCIPFQITWMWKRQYDLIERAPIDLDNRYF